MAKLSDRQHKAMIARYAETNNYSLVAREFGVSEATVRNHCKGDKKTSEICEQKKEQNTLDMISFMESRKDKAQAFVDMCLEEMTDRRKIGKSGVQSIAVAMGIVIDKFTQNVTESTNENTLLQEIRDGIEEGKQYVE